MLTVVEKVIVLQKVEVFTEVSTEPLSFLAAIADVVSYPAQQRIFECGDPADALYVVLDGSVRLHRNDEDISVVQAGEAFGTWALFEEAPRVASATVIDEAQLLRIGRDDFLDLLSDHGDVMQGVLKTLVRRLRGLLDRLGTAGRPASSSSDAGEA